MIFGSTAYYVRDLGGADRISRPLSLIPTAISVSIFQPTSNIHLTASAYNAPSHFSAPGCFQWLARGQSYAFQESQSPKLLPLRPPPQTLFLPLPSSSPKSDPGCGGPTTPSADSRSTASICARPSKSINSSMASFDGLIGSTMGSRTLPFVHKNRASRWGSPLSATCQGFFTAALLSERLP